MDLTPIFKNCLEVRRNGEAYLPVRFTQKQLDFYGGYNDLTLDRSWCSAGMKMEFYTAAETISFSCRTSHFCRSFCTFDICENDDLKETVRFEDRPTEVTVSYTVKTPGKKKITVYLPFSCCTELYAWNFGDLSFVEDAPRRKYLAYGDSITQNMTTEYGSIAYPTLLAKHFNMELLNQGIGTFRYCKESLDENLPYKPDVITVAYGTNDLSQIEDDREVERNALAYLTELKRIFDRAEIYVISPIWRQTKIRESEEKYERFIRYQSILENVCKSLSLPFICGLHLVPDLGDFYVDGLHPNAKGFLIYGLNLIREIEALQA